LKDDRLYLEHILEAVKRIREYTTAGKERLLADGMTQDAVIRNLQVLGEAAKRVSAATVAANPDVPWRQMAGLRDRVVHDYFGVSLEIVWDVVENHLDAVVREVTKVLEADER
jgi:uncharacterized protein with HEPN domain